MDQGEIRQEAGRAGGEHADASRPATTTAKRPSYCRSTTACRRRNCRRAPIARSPATRRCATAWSRPATSPILISSTPAIRSRRPATSCISSAELKRFGVKAMQAEDEIAAVGMAIGASFGGSLGVTATSGPGHLPEVRGDRPGGHDRVAARHHRRATRRAEHGSADQDRASRFAASHVWPQRRVPGGDRRPGSPADCFDMMFEAVRIATRFMTPVFLLSDGYLGQRRRAVANPRIAKLPKMTVTHPSPMTNGQANGHAGTGSHGTADVLTVHARRTAGATLGHPRHARPRTPHRRHRERRRHRQRQLRPGQPRAHGADAGSEDRQYRQRDSGTGRRRAADGRPAGASAGAAPTASIADRRRSGRSARARRSPMRICAISTRCRRTPAMCSRATRKCWSRN